MICRENGREEEINEGKQELEVEEVQEQNLDDSQSTEDLTNFIAPPPPPPLYIPSTVKDEPNFLDEITNPKVVLKKVQIVENTKPDVYNGIVFFFSLKDIRGKQK